eukprot:jgi/Chlat1/6337/Chrsp44S05893
MAARAAAIAAAAGWVASVQELPREETRWFYAKAPVTHLTTGPIIPESNSLRRFSHYDSIVLEIAFRKKEQEYIAEWWKEYGEAGGSHKDETSVADVLPNAEDDADEVDIGVVVRGGLYEVDLKTRLCTTAYWIGEAYRVQRGTWFAEKSSATWLPVREDVAEQLETAYRNQATFAWRKRIVQSSGVNASRVELSTTLGWHALFMGEGDQWEAYLCPDDMTTKLTRALTGSSGSKPVGYKLRRGYLHPDVSTLSTTSRAREEREDYCAQVPVGHLMLVVHGIGQRMLGADFPGQVGTMRDAAYEMAKQNLPLELRSKQRVEYLPVLWRKTLAIAADDLADEITMDSLRSVRDMLNATALDVLYYMSPPHCQNIIFEVTRSLNRVYRKFRRRNPVFTGKVSIIGHSLGSVLVFDILSHQAGGSAADYHPDTEQEREDHTALLQSAFPNLRDSPPTTPVAAATPAGAGIEAVEAPAASTPSPTTPPPKPADIQIASLQTQIDQLQSRIDALKTASPAAESAEDLYEPLFRSPQSQKPERPDPVAENISYSPPITYMRLLFPVHTYIALGSPLGLFLALRGIMIGPSTPITINKEMPAVEHMFNLFHPYDIVAYRLEPLVTRDMSKIKPVRVPYHKGGSRFHIGVQKFSEDIWAGSSRLSANMRSVFSKKSSSGPSEQDDPEKITDPVLLTLASSNNGRMDFALQEASFENAYLAAVNAHWIYWTDNDTALFIMNHIYKDIDAVATTSHRRVITNEEPSHVPSVNLLASDGVKPDPTAFQNAIADSEAFHEALKMVSR